MTWGVTVWMWSGQLAVVTSLIVSVFLKSCYWYSQSVWHCERSRQILLLLFLIHPDNPSTLFSPSSMNPLWPVSFSFCLFPRRLFLFRPLCFKQTERFTKSSPRFFRLVSQNSLRQDLTLWPLAANEGSQPSTVSDVSASPLPVSSSDKPAWFVPAGTAIEHLLIWHWD